MLLSQTFIPTTLLGQSTNINLKVFLTCSRTTMTISILISR